ncbi:hypothetical protein P4O66_014120 [Electrophorus voltai]|uniref:Angiomotin C-terminal domain-containing protein n=1 Tax=Electrophorus voltai TaxID=2609070 RepID=A0AAD8Z2B7_9TELE|nr:hypothetical protein P4O66_014120 [Electrophorus voltai]
MFVREIKKFTEDHLGLSQWDDLRGEDILVNTTSGEVTQLFGVCPCPAPPTAPPTAQPVLSGASMRSSEDGVSGTVLQRLMQEHLRYGTGSTGGGTEHDGVSLPHMLSPNNPVSTENLLFEEEGPAAPLYHSIPPQTQPRQEPQGQEHQVDSSSMEKSGGGAQSTGGSVQAAHTVPGLGGLELPSYEEAKSQSQLFRGQQSQNDQQSHNLGHTHTSLQTLGHTIQALPSNPHPNQNLQTQVNLKMSQPNLVHPNLQQGAQVSFGPSSTSSCPPSLSSAPSLASPPSLSSSSVPVTAHVEGRAWLQRGCVGIAPPRDEGLAELKQGHVRSLSERIMQLSLERNGAKQSRELSSTNLREYSPHGPDRPAISPSSTRKSSKATPPPIPPPPKAFVDHRGPPPEYPFKLKTQTMYPTSPSPLSAEHTQVSGEGLLPSVPHQNSPLPSQTSGLIPSQVPVPPYQSAPSLQSLAIPQAQAGPGAQGPPLRMAPQGQHVPGDMFAMANHAQQMLEVLSEENQRLRQELLSQSEKSSNLQRLESEVGHLSDAYESLVKSSSKRETLDKTMRMKLEGEIRRLHDFNRDLRDRLDTANRQLANQEIGGQEDGRLYLSERRESLREMERLEMEAATVRSANEDQRRHIEIMEQALNNAQTKVVRLEEELGKKQVYVERVERLQQALGQLQAACEKREQLEKRLRTRLERELETLRSQQRAGVGVGLPMCESSAPALLDLLREREERILGLEADMMRWEQKYLEESAMRQFAMEAAATAAAQRDTTIIQHSRSGSYSDGCLWQHDGEDKTHSRHCQDIETRMKDLHAQLLEKKAMIKVMEHRSRRDSTPLRPARSVPSISIATGIHSRQTSQTECREMPSWKGSTYVLLGKESVEHLPASLPSFSASLSSLAPSLTSSLAPSLTSSLAPPLASSLAPSFPPLSASSLPLPSPMTSSSSSASLLPFSSATLPLPSMLHPSPLPLPDTFSSLPSTPLLSLHSKSSGRDSSTQTGRSPEAVRAMPPTGRAKTGKTDSPPTQTKSPDSRALTSAGQKIRLPDSDLVEILI